MSYLHYEAYGHGEAPTAPVGNTDECIIGLEMEIGSFHDYSGINAAIEDGLVGCYDVAADNIQIEEEAQHNVDYEIIFNADSPAAIRSRLEELNCYIGGTYEAYHDCSCHIHMNRQYLSDSLGLSELEIQKAAEALAPIIYAISGRDYDSLYEWAKPEVSLRDYSGLLSRLEAVDELSSYQSGRYRLCNRQNSSTIEIRAFSNYHEGSFDYISSYIEIAADLIPAVAVAMQGKSYAENPKILFQTAEPFFEAKRALFERDCPIKERWLNNWANWKDAILDFKTAQYKAAISQYEKVEAYLNEAATYLAFTNPHRHNCLAAAEYLVKALRANTELKISRLDLEDPAATLREIREANNRFFKNKVWRL